MDAPPPPPPPHGDNPKTTSGGQGSGLPPGNYDIFIIPPHSSGSGFLYLPSLAIQRNSFLAGVACTLLAVLVWNIIQPTIKQWVSAVTSSGGGGVLILVIGVGVAGWAMGKTQLEGGVPGAGGPGAGPGAGAGANHTAGAGAHSGPRANGFPGGFANSPPPGAGAGSHAGGNWGGNTHNASGWDKAREQTRQREEARRQADDESKKKEDAEREARAQAEKQKWEQMRTREKEQREREARERLARERLAKDKAEREAREKEAAERLEKDIRERLQKEAAAKAEAEAAAAKAKAEAEAAAAKERAAKDREERLKAARERAERERKARDAERQTKPASESGVPRQASSSPTKPYERPTARTTASNDSRAYSGFRPYDTPRTARTTASSSIYSESVASSSYAPSTSTARTTPPPSHRSPYSTADPDKVVIKGVYLFTSLFPKPVAQLVSGVGAVTDGLVLRMTTEGLFIDDDVRGVAQREWDVKAWTMKLVETAEIKSSGAYIVRASIRDPEGKRYVFVLGMEESWKVATGLARLRKGSQVRALGVQGMPPGEANKVLGVLGVA